MVETDLLEKLNAYCNELIGEKSTKQKKHGDSRKQKKNSNANSILKLGVENISKQDERNISKQNSSNEKNSNIKKTDDGFKIISEIPSDDSDISDAFYSDEEDIEKPSTNVGVDRQETEDGFKIISDIPPDDSDISDAFESDIDESEWVSEARERLKNKTHLNEKNSNKSIENISKIDQTPEQSKLHSVKNPLRKLIQDFDLQDKIFLNEKSEPRLKSCTVAPTAVQKKKCLSSEQLTIIDYSSKKKKKREREEQPEGVKTSSSSKSPEEAENAFKKARYEIFKFGLSGFKKQDRKNAKIQLAVKLGAKPPKKRSKNYKKLIEETKLKKQKEVIKREEERQAGLPVKKPSRAREKRRDVNPTNINPPVGKFRNGVLSLSKKDMHKMNVQR